MNTPNINYFADSSQFPYFFTSQVMSIAKKLRQTLNGNITINVYPDATYKSRGLVNGIAFVSRYQDTMLLPEFLLDLGCGFTTFKIKLHNKNDAWHKKAGLLLDKIVNGDKLKHFDPKLDIRDILLHGLDLFTIADKDSFLHKSFKVDTTYFEPDDDMLMDFADYFLAVTNTIELKTIYKIFDQPILLNNNINSNDIIGFIHTGSKVTPCILRNHFSQYIADYCELYGLFSPDEIAAGVYGARLNTEVGLEYYQWLKASMNYALANRYNIFLLVKKILEANFDCEVTMLSDIIHCGVLEEDFNNQRIVKSFRGVQPVCDNKVNLLAGQRESLSALFTRGGKANDYYNMCAHGTSYNILNQHDYSKKFSASDADNYLNLAKQAFYNSEAKYERTLAYNYNLLESISYFEKIQLIKSTALLAPLVNVQNDFIKTTN